jgi:hypothetical protein
LEDFSTDGSVQLKWRVCRMASFSSVEGQLAGFCGNDCSRSF